MQHSNQLNYYPVLIVVLPGFEPGLRVLETPVLPLHHRTLYDSFTELSYYYLKLFNKTVKTLNLIKNSFSDIIFKYF